MLVNLIFGLHVRIDYEMIRIMNGVVKISRSVAQAWLTGVWLFLVVYFAVHAFQGDSSLSVLRSLDAQMLELQMQARDSGARRVILEQKVVKMGGNALDPDLLEELVRAKLGFTHPDEVILLLE